MATVRLYSWDDAGAPAFNYANDGSLIRILRACLVNGYGSKPAAGWTEEFTEGASSNIAGLRPSEGTNAQLLVIDDEFHLQAARVYACKDATGYRQGDVDPWSGNPTSSNTGRWMKRYGSSSDYQQWHVIASESFVYWINTNPVNSAGTAYFFGNINNLSPTFQFGNAMCMYYTSSNPSTSHFQYGLQDMSSSYIWAHSDISGVISPDRKVDSIDTIRHVTNGYGVNQLDGKIRLMDFPLFTNKLLMGYFPNMYVMEYPFSPTATAEPYLPPGVTKIPEDMAPLDTKLVSVATRSATNKATFVFEVDEW